MKHMKIVYSLDFVNNEQRRLVLFVYSSESLKCFEYWSLGAVLNSCSIFRCIGPLDSLKVAVLKEACGAYFVVVVRRLVNLYM